MPLYEYQCETCGQVTDIRHGFRETTAERCAHCGGPLKRLFNAAGIVFKGSGFYVTDSRKGAGGSDATASGSSKGDSSKSDAPKGDAAAKADAPKGDAAKSDKPKNDGGPKNSTAA